MPIYNLPNHIFLHIRDFVFDTTSFDSTAANRRFLGKTVVNYSKPTSWRNFVNTNKKQFLEIKRQTVYYNLNHNSSVEILQLEPKTPYASRKISNLTLERLKELSLQDMGKQLEFTIYCRGLSLKIVEEILKNLSENLKTFPFSVENFTLKLDNFRNDVSELSFVTLPSLKNLKILTNDYDRSRTITLIFPPSMRLEAFYCEIPCIFSDPTAMKCFQSARMVKMPLKDPSMDISAFGGVARLDLSYSSIKDVSSLRHVHTLNLQGCSEVVDVSMLGEVYDLNINKCPRILSINGLGKVKKLSIRELASLQDGLPIDAEAKEIITDSITYQLAGISKLKDHKKKVGNRVPSRLGVGPFGPSPRIEVGGPPFNLPNVQGGPFGGPNVQGGPFGGPNVQGGPFGGPNVQGGPFGGPNVQGGPFGGPNVQGGPFGGPNVQGGPFGGPNVQGRRLASSDDCLFEHFQIPFSHVSVLNHDLRNYSDLTGIEDLVLTRSILPPEFPTAFFPQLKRLLLLECEGIDRLMFDRMPNLKVLKIDGCVDLKNVTVEHEMDELVLFANAKIVNLTIGAPLKLLNVIQTSTLEMIDLRAPVSRFKTTEVKNCSVNMNY